MTIEFDGNDAAALAGKRKRNVAPADERLISLDLPAVVAAECVEVAKATGMPLNKVREIVRQKAASAAEAAVAGQVKAIVREELVRALGGEQATIGGGG